MTGQSNQHIPTLESQPRRPILLVTTTHPVLDSFKSRWDPIRDFDIFVEFSATGSFIPFKIEKVPSTGTIILQLRLQSCTRSSPELRLSPTTRTTTEV